MLRKLIVGVAIAGVLAAVLAISAACGGDNDSGMGMGGEMTGMMSGRPPEGAIRVSLVNWAVEPAQTTAEAGEITFWAVHDMQHAHGGDAGGNIHDLQVMRKTADGSFKLVGEVKGLRMGDAKALTLDLTPGEYELACTVVEVVGDQAVSHYTKGMRTPFRVTG